jgi:hypothetical protein
VSPRNIAFLLFVLGCLASISFGYRHWQTRRDVFMARFEKPAKFLLVDTDTHVFDSTSSSLSPLQLYVFMANDISRQDMKEFTDFWPKFNKAWGAKTQIILVSRISVDLLINFKSITKFPGTILVDPVGVSGRLFGFWQNISQDDGWHYVLLSGAKSFKVWSYDSKSAATFDAISEKLKAAISDAAAN